MAGISICLPLAPGPFDGNVETFLAAFPCRILH
jgi:hypothetical protein